MAARSDNVISITLLQVDFVISHDPLDLSHA